MPVEFDEYRDKQEAAETLAIDPGSNAHKILSFLTDHPELGFKPAEIAEEVDIPPRESQSDTCSVRRARISRTWAPVLVGNRWWSDCCYWGNDV